MSWICVNRRITAWLSCLVLLFAALAPSVSHALQSSRGAGWVEVCTADGSRWVAAGAEDSNPLPAQAHGLEHCPFCSLHAPTPGLPPADLLVVPPAGRDATLPPAFLHAPSTAHAWRSAQPRAPPFALS